MAKNITPVHPGVKPPERGVNNPRNTRTRILASSAPFPSYSNPRHPQLVSLLPWRTNRDKIQENQDTLQDALEEIRNTQDQVQDLESSTEDRISELEDDVTQLRGQVADMMAGVDLTDTQKQIVALYMMSNHPRTKHDIAEDLGLSKSYVSKLLSEIREEVFEDVKSPLRGC